MGIRTNDETLNSYNTTVTTTPAHLQSQCTHQWLKATVNAQVSYALAKTCIIQTPKQKTPSQAISRYIEQTDKQEERS